METSYARAARVTSLIRELDNKLPLYISPDMKWVVIHKAIQKEIDGAIRAVEIGVDEL